MQLNPLLVPDSVNGLYLRDYMCTIRYNLSNVAMLTKITINLRYYLSEAYEVYKKSKMLTNSKTYNKTLACISKAS